MLVDFALVGQRERRLSTKDTIREACLLRLGYWLKRRPAAAAEAGIAKL
jgi:hypothetical protein